MSTLPSAERYLALVLLKDPGLGKEIAFLYAEGLGALPPDMKKAASHLSVWAAGQDLKTRLELAVRVMEDEAWQGNPAAVQLAIQSFQAALDSPEYGWQNKRKLIVDLEAAKAALRSLPK